MNNDLIIHEQRQETERKNRASQFSMILLSVGALVIVYFSTRDIAEENAARRQATKMGCTYMSNHTDETKQKVLVANCNGAIIHKAYE